MADGSLARFTLLLVFTFVGGGTMLQAAPPRGFAPPGMWTNDNWFAQSGDTYHVFYLQAPRCIGIENRWTTGARLAQIGHATSHDLANWTDQGPVVVPVPGSWIEALATGSVARFQGKWYMVFTVNAGKPGVALAESDDLMTWKLVGDGPVAPRQEYTGVWQGQPLQWRPCADPYLYPEPLEGWMTLVINAQVVGAPVAESGCLATLRSRDLRTWEPGPVLLYPQSIERLETPQLWSHGDRWYLYFGAAHDQPAISTRWQATVPEALKTHRRVNCFYLADRWDGPYRPLPGQWWLDQLAPDCWGYIHKVLRGPDGHDVMITTADMRVSPAYRVVYGADGSLRVE